MQPTTPSTPVVPSPALAAAGGLRTVAFSLLVDRALSV
jgi:hypothetical protein